KQDAVFNMTEGSMNGVGGFNGRNSNKEDIAYYFIGGNQSPFNVLGQILYGQFGRKHDGLVSSYSAIGWEYPNANFNPANWTSDSPPQQYFTNEVHIPDWGNSYYTAPQGYLYSYSFECIKKLLKQQMPNPAFCYSSAANGGYPKNQSEQAPPTTSIFTEKKSGHLSANQSTSIPVIIDGNATGLFYLTWNGETPSFTLTRPDTQMIDPAYAGSHPAEVTYQMSSSTMDVPPFIAYKFMTLQPGVWQLNITASGAIDYQGFAILESARILDVQTDANNYTIGDNLTIVANLISNGTGLSGANISAKLTHSDNTVNIVPLLDQGNGVYQGTYSIPNAPGYLNIEVTANGDENGTSFSRQKNLIIAIAPRDIQLNNNYSDEPFDNNSDGFYDYLNFQAQVNLSASGEYAVAADLFAGNEFITHSGDFFSLPSGLQTVTLSFDGRDIRKAHLNGPYTIKNLYFVPVSVGITAESAESPWITTN
ncbi:MAG TPA: hypothetical protein PKC38_11795, partial [Chitinophagales bacterium]|nr:hypothetical protein [Chitinophagales bacterium]